MSRKKKFVHKIGDAHTVDGVPCVVRFVNQGIGFLFPTYDDDTEPRLYKCCVYAKIYPSGEVKK